jgi:hypothetical protein
VAAVKGEKHGLCEEHREEQIRLHQVKVQGWKVKRQERDANHLSIMSVSNQAEKDALFAVATDKEIEEFHGEINVIAAIHRGALMNFVLGLNKGYVPQPGWVGGGGSAFKTLASGLSLAAARKYADEYNTRLGDLGVTEIKAVPAI